MIKFYDEPLPYYCSIDNLAPGEVGGGGGAPPPVGGEGDTKEPPKPSIRDQLEKGFETDRRAGEPGSRGRGPRSRARRTGN